MLLNNAIFVRHDSGSFIKIQHSKAKQLAIA